MANTEFVTTCNEAKVKDRVEAQAYLDRYWFDGEDITVEIDEAGFLQIYGYSYLNIYHTTPDGELEDDFDDLSDEFWKGLGKYLSEPFILQQISWEKCRYPLNACQIKVMPNGEVVYKQCLDYE